jgi:hypothetical protein
MNTNTHPQEWVRHWQVARRNGAVSYLIRRGIPVWGALMLLITITLSIVNGPSLTARSLIVAVLLSTVSGAVLASLQWMTSERRYKQYLGASRRPGA